MMMQWTAPAVLPTWPVGTARQVWGRSSSRPVEERRGGAEKEFKLANKPSSVLTWAGLAAN